MESCFICEFKCDRISGMYSKLPFGITWDIKMMVVLHETELKPNKAELNQACSHITHENYLSMLWSFKEFYCEIDLTKT